MKKPNVFTILVFCAAFAFVFRLANMVTPVDEKVASVSAGTTRPAQAQVEDSQEEPPPLLTQEDVNTSVDQTVKSLAAGKTEDKPEGDAPAQRSLPTYDSARVFSESEVEVLQSLAQRRDELDVREKNLSQREALLRAAEQEVDRKVAELNKLKTEMQDLLGQQEEAAEKRIRSLTKIYENMKPKDAAAIFDTLEMDILLGVIGRMSERKASPILANMNPETAREVTVKLAEERRLPEKQ